MEHPSWAVAWASLCGNLIDELPPEALGALRVAFKKGGATDMRTLFDGLNGQAAFVGPKAEQNLATLLFALSRWEDVDALVRLRKEVASYYPKLGTQPVIQTTHTQAGDGAQLNSLTVAKLFDIDLRIKNQLRDTLGAGQPARWHEVAVHLSEQPPFRGKITGSWVQNIEDNYPNGPTRAMAFLNAFCQLQGATVASLVKALEAAALDVLAQAIRDAAAGL